MQRRQSLRWFFLLLLAIACRSPETERPRLSRNQTLLVNLGVYTPGTQLPFGEPLRAAADLADDYCRLHPGVSIRFVQLANVSGSQEGEWLKTQLVGGMAPDIIAQNAEIAWPDVDKGWYIPLDDYLQQPNPYAAGNRRWFDLFENQALLDAKRAADGRLYCLSIDVVETGIFYNKTLFKELGLHIPETWAEYIRLLGVLQQNGYTGLTSPINLGSDWGQDVLFDMLYYPIIAHLDVEPSRENQRQYLSHYLTAKEVVFLFQKGYFTRRDSRWAEMHRLLKEWRSYWGKELKYSDTSRFFLTRRAATVWEGSWFARRLFLDPYIDFEWGIFYLPPITAESTPYGEGAEASVIGGSAVQLHVTESARLYDHLDTTIDFLQFLTAPQNFSRIIDETLLFLPNIRGVESPPELNTIRDIFTRRYCAIKWLETFDAKTKARWRRMLDLFLNDGISQQDYLAHLETIFSDYADEQIAKYKWTFDDYEKIWRKNGLQVE
ncbi:carbohydrate ABC transporter substrate-binding protein [candidate division KSB1 bacterium]|nr:carbohydrate ABC transporter substrate-binding protein [candidate division KSB1 bacterium]